MRPEKGEQSPSGRQKQMVFQEAPKLAELEWESREWECKALERLVG